MKTYKHTVSFTPAEQKRFKAAVAKLNKEYFYEGSDGRVQMLVHHTLLLAGCAAILKTAECIWPAAVDIREETPEENRARVDGYHNKAEEAPAFDLTWLKQHFPSRWS